MTKELLNPKRHPLTEITDRNLASLAEKLTILENEYCAPFQITSGLRSTEEQQRINPKSTKSAHLTGEACDILDTKKMVWDFMLSNFDLVEELGLYLESKIYTPKHVHIQTRKPKSGNRIFIP